MHQNRIALHRSLRSSFVAGLVGSTALFAACAEDPPGLFDPVTGTGGNTGGSGGTSSAEAGESSGGTMSSGGTGAVGTGGRGGTGGGTSTGGASSGGHAGSHGPSTGGASTASGGSGDATNEDGGMGGDDGAGGESDAGGSSGNGAGGSAGDGAGGSSAGTGQGGSGPLSCVYTSPPVPQQGGAGGGAGTSGAAGTGGAPVYDINVRVSPTVGKYLADASGMTLYIRTSDLPGDCQSGNPPVSRCTVANGACSTTWPVFNAGARTLDPQLDPNAFGTILREDGLYETTYFGWPLYTYISDTAAGQIVGQGKGKVWFVAEVKLPNVVIMQEGSTKYLADDTGHTLYVSSADVLGTGNSDPVSNCDGTCRATYEPFSSPRLYAVQALEQDDFTYFVNPAGPLQVAYKGAPLYRAKTDLQGGDQTGVAGTFALVLP